MRIPRARLTPFIRQKILEEYIRGDKIEAIASKYGISRDYPSHIAAKNGYPTRRYHTVCPHCKKKLTDVRTTEMHQIPV